MDVCDGMEGTVPLTRIRAKLMVCVMTLTCNYICVSASSTFCKVEALNGGSVSVQCTYPMNLRDTKQSISLMHFGTNGERTTVAYSCAWNEEQLICVNGKGFFYPTNFTNELTFEVDNPYNNAEFSCDTISPDKSLTVERCRLIRKSNDSAANTTDSTVPPLTTCKPTQVDEKDSSCTALIAPIAVLSAMMTLFTGVLLVLWIRKRRCNRSEENIATPELHGGVLLHQQASDVL